MQNYLIITCPNNYLLHLNFQGEYVAFIYALPNLNITQFKNQSNSVKDNILKWKLKGLIPGKNFFFLSTLGEAQDFNKGAKILTSYL